MIIIPAIDIRQGKSVRLKQGKLDAETIYSNDPLFLAKLWQAKGAERIHIVDLDGAFSCINNNREIIKQICSSINIPIEVGGGIRDLEKINEIFDLGATYVILGTVAIYNPDIIRRAIEKYGSDKILVSIDARCGKIAIDGWKDVTAIDVLELLTELYKIGIHEIIYTDITRDGMFTGPDISGISKLNEFCDNKIRIIASGGIKTVHDIIKLKKYKNVVATIVGSALYTNDFNLEDSIKKLHEVDNIQC
ncbi:MAG: 1-(5-phosphoribosyl)-5-[(5-phosphoribosylamino)methylideneamino]imidazole-4-carboxamide isomerase [Endomicrobium sp.]|jgi:phosphoribosylformimino-5-aminoimidazole carboxamide ribotide isomerase|nr:1-(5-phosphoribosyl)-5-[(5-phosphoribosylamino)methylideneamino]imidazole-4-carboxamide isomerase [Endomicrobium sp.]